MSLVKSVVCNEFGGCDKIEVKDFPLQELDDNDVEVEVHYCGLNFSDLYTRLGLFPKETKTFILGIECSGIIRAVGKNVTLFKVEDRVVCYNYCGTLHRTTVILPFSNCYPIPDSISLQTACAAFVAFLTAHCALFEAGGLCAGHHVLVHSCAGAVGSAAVQLARTVPDVVIWGTTSDEKKVTPGDVDHVVSHEGYLEVIPTQSLDLVVDNQACKKFEENLNLLKPFGRIIIIGASYMIKDNNTLVPPDASSDNSVVLRLVMDSVSIGGLHLGEIAGSVSGAQRLNIALKRIWGLLIEGKVSARIDSVWPFDTDNVRNATQLLHTRKNKGKILLKTQHAREES